MLSNEEKKRYSKQTILPEVGLPGQELLKAAKVLVVGAGGLGCPVLQYLAAAGVGIIGIADGDEVDISNLQRQVLYTTADVGKGKAATAAGKLSALNPNVQCDIYPFFIDNDNALDVIGGYDIVVDGSDNFATRYLVNDACVILGKPMVSGAIYKFEGQVSVFNYKVGPTYRCLFPEAPGLGESPNCAEIGVVATLPGIVGSIQANEVIKIITGIGEVLSGRLLMVDTLTMSNHTFHFTLNPINRNITALQTTTEQQCEMLLKEVSYNEFQAMQLNVKSLQLVDVREQEEHEIFNIGGINVPLSRLDADLALLDPSVLTIVYCASGVRGKRSVQLLLQNGFTQVLNLQGGVNGLFT